MHCGKEELLIFFSKLSFILFVFLPKILLKNTDLYNSNLIFCPYNAGKSARIYIYLYKCFLFCVCVCVCVCLRERERCGERERE